MKVFKKATFQSVPVLSLLTFTAMIVIFIGSKIFIIFCPASTGDKIQIQNLQDRLTSFQKDCGRFPTTKEGLQALVTPPSTMPKCKTGEKGARKDWEIDAVSYSSADVPIEYISGGENYVMKSVVVGEENLFAIGTSNERGRLYKRTND